MTSIAKNDLPPPKAGPGKKWQAVIACVSGDDHTALIKQTLVETGKIEIAATRSNSKAWERDLDPNVDLVIVLRQGMSENLTNWIDMEASKARARVIRMKHPTRNRIRAVLLHYPSLAIKRERVTAAAPPVKKPEPGKQPPEPAKRPPKYVKPGRGERIAEAVQFVLSSDKGVTTTDFAAKAGINSKAAYQALRRAAHNKLVRRETRYGVLYFYPRKTVEPKKAPPPPAPKTPEPKTPPAKPTDVLAPPDDFVERAVNFVQTHPHPPVTEATFATSINSSLKTARAALRKAADRKLIRMQGRRWFYPLRPWTEVKTPPPKVAPPPPRPAKVQTSTLIADLMSAHVDQIATIETTLAKNPGALAPHAKLILLALAEHRDRVEAELKRLTGK